MNRFARIIPALLVLSLVLGSGSALAFTVSVQVADDSVAQEGVYRLVEMKPAQAATHAALDPARTEAVQPEARIVPADKK